MKSLTAAGALALWAFAATEATVADWTSRCIEGEECTNTQGQASRCNSIGQCMNDLKPCPSSSSLLQRCHPTKTRFCYPLFDNGALQCLDLAEIDPVVSRGICVEKPDGDKCIKAYSDMNGPSLATATVFELEGVCDLSECVTSIHLSCMYKQLSANCTYESIWKGNLVSFTGTCINPGVNLMNRCEPRGSPTVIRPAKVLAAPPMTPAPSSEAPHASKTPSSSPSVGSGSGAPDSDVSNPFDSDTWTVTAPPFTFKPYVPPFTFEPYVPETPRPPSYSYTSSSSGDSDPTLKIVFGVVGCVLVATYITLRLIVASPSEAEATPVVVEDHPHTPGVDAAYVNLEVGGTPKHTRQ